MANYILRKAILDNIRVPIGSRMINDLPKIGNREVVGYGFNGQANYQDRSDFPMPAIRFREDDTEIKILREKEKGDWRKLSIEEKKVLYRASFCQTYAEFQRHTGEWKYVVGWGLVLTCLGVWLTMANAKFVNSERPASLSDESQKAQLKRMLDLKINPIDGLSSNWDYENNRWK